MVAVVRRRGRKRSLRSTGGTSATSSGGSPQKSSPRRAPRAILPAAGAKLWLHPSATPPKGPFWPGAEPVADRGRPHRTRARTANQWIFRAGEMGFWRLISSITSCTHSHAAYSNFHESSTPAVYEAREVPEIRYRAFHPRVGHVAIFHKTTITLNFVQQRVTVLFLAGFNY